jgi:hypothetical protein
LKDYEALLLENGQIITAFEVLLYFIDYTMLLLEDEKTELATILAFENYLEGFDFFDLSSDAVISPLLSITKIKKVYELIEK